MNGTTDQELNRRYAVSVKGWELLECTEHGDIYHNGKVLFVSAEDFCAELGRGEVLRQLLPAEAVA